MQNPTPDELARKASSVIDDKKDAAARGLDSAAAAIHGEAEALPGGERVARAAHATADAMQRSADYVRDQDVEEMLSDVRQLVTRHPGITLVAAAALGFLLARTLSRD